ARNPHLERIEFSQIDIWRRIPILTAPDDHIRIQIKSHDGILCRAAELQLNAPRSRLIDGLEFEWHRMIGDFLWSEADSEPPQPRHDDSSPLNDVQLRGELIFFLRVIAAGHKITYPTVINERNNTSCYPNLIPDSGVCNPSHVLINAYYCAF